MNSVKVTFSPENIEVYVLPGTRIIEAAARAGIIIETPCGGKGTCGKCKVQVIEGKIEPTSTEIKLINKYDLNKGIRLACESFINSSCVIHIPQESKHSVGRILTTGLKGKKEIKPSIWKIYMELSGSTLENQTADLDMIRKVVPNGFKTDIYIIRKLSEILRESEFKITCVFSGNELISIEKGDTTKINYGVAFDIGTTTLVGTLLDANTGQELSVTARMNPQSIYAADVISRINLVIQEKDGLEKLHYQLIGKMNEMIDELANNASIDKKNIYKIVAAGNSTMQHLLLKLNPKNLGSVPFSISVREGIEIKAKKIGIDINSDGSIFVFPNIAGFVGGDTVAGILATEIHKSKDIKLLIDIGTNGEIVLGNKNKLISASTAAGPAFEGARISQGMRASEGAIEKVILNEDVKFNVIGNIAPFGLCGTGLIDAVAQMLRKGIIDTTGRIVDRKELQGKISEKLLNRIIEKDGQNNFLLVYEEFTQSKRPIFITQKDVRELQLAKAAISAGIKILLKELQIEEKEISEILLAGAFGNFIRRSSAKQIGLIPDVPSEKVRFVGNTASSGAEMVLLSNNLKEEVELISKNTGYIELSTKADFNELFMEEMIFKYVNKEDKNENE